MSAMAQFKDKPVALFGTQRWKRLLMYAAGCVGLVMALRTFRFGQSRRVSSAAPTAAGSYDVLADILHLNNLNEVCFHEKEAIISYGYNSTAVDTSLTLHSTTDHAILIQFLSQCPDVDIYLPPGLRNHGYCEDGMAYVKFLKTRVLPRWVFDIELQHQGKTIKYFDLCPHTALLFMNHYFDGIPDLADFPPDKKIVLMPNVEMYELKASHYHRADYVLAKTYDGYQRITAWYDREGNPRRTKVFYTQHVSSDPTQAARRSPTVQIAPRDFSNLRFFHANGHSTEKMTYQLLECWSRRPDFPRLDVYSMDDHSKKAFDRFFKDKPVTNLRYNWGQDVDVVEFGKLMAEVPVILCPSGMEGFGHYINQARASGALVATTDAAPMNELIDAESGVLIDGNLWTADAPKQVMAQGYRIFREGLFREGMEYMVHPENICAAVDAILALTPTERAERARRGRQRYLDQFQYFRTQMHAFRKQLLFDVHGQV
ncbi:hypothetical protein, variant 1 [Aphanomyces invadans]|uniref:Glycosyl transferase family 1 domain-containing protein n=2 Tax=Aphanomyces invadans TaxID=157072 RepID=A0A024TP50_9STRA|nr:hypothetical protein, variant 1 [Aphanomyces invadans]ETV95147.1 hypothetical protein, variant 1 [Aphanomyces invadans]|eukprot:XP_008876320.1 hypothetical protein, variant 1 [Aphanomyces invadans]